MRYHQSQQEKNDSRLSVLSKVADKYDYTGVEFPASYDDIARFEELNKVCVFVYIINEEGKIHKERDGNLEIFAERYSVSAEDRAGGELPLHLHQAH